MAMYNPWPSICTYSKQLPPTEQAEGDGLAQGDPRPTAQGEGRSSLKASIARLRRRETAFKLTSLIYIVIIHTKCIGASAPAAVSLAEPATATSRPGIVITKKRSRL